jgi:hypothetical protein
MPGVGFPRPYREQARGKQGQRGRRDGDAAHESGEDGEGNSSREQAMACHLQPGGSFRRQWWMPQPKLERCDASRREIRTVSSAWGEPWRVRDRSHGKRPANAALSGTCIILQVQNR